MCPEMKVGGMEKRKMKFGMKNVCLEAKILKFYLRLVLTTQKFATTKFFLRGYHLIYAQLRLVFQIE